MASSKRWTAACCAILTLAACGPDVQPTADLPAIPAISPDLFPGNARADVDRLITALEASPLDAQRNADLAMFTHAYEQFDAAEALYRRTAVLDGSSFRWPYYLGVVLSRQQRQEDAAKAYEDALAIDREFVPLRLKLAESYLGLNRLEEAEELYRAVLEESPSNADAHYGLGRVRSLRGDSASAIEQLSEAVALVPAYGQAHYELSLAYRDSGDSANAQKHLARYEANPRGAPPLNDPLMAEVDRLRQGVNEFIAQSVELESRGDLPGAIALHLQALEVDPNVPQLHVNLVSLYGRTGNFDKAEEHYRKALALNPNQADLHYNYGVLLFEAERYRAAKTAFEDALQANPSYAAAHNNLGQLLEQEGRIDDAMAKYQAAIEVRPDYRLARFHLGRMLMAKRRPAEAAKQFEQAAQPVDEMSPQALFGLTAAQAQLGDRAGALRTGAQARDLALQMGQAELARRIEQDLAKLR